jgi:hypothetical protein
VEAFGLEQEPRPGEALRLVQRERVLVQRIGFAVGWGGSGVNFMKLFQP